MVKSAAKSGGSTSTSAATPSQQSLPQMQTGQNPHDPLTQLNSHLGFGAMAGFNPFTGMDVNPNDPNMVRLLRLLSKFSDVPDAETTWMSIRVCPQMQNMLNSPQFLEQMSSVFSNPQIMDQLMAMNPQLGGMDPQMRQMFQSERFRQMMCVGFHFPHSWVDWTNARTPRSNPDTLRTMVQMAGLMREMGGGPTSGGFPGMGDGLSGLGGLGGTANPTTAPNQTTNANTTSQTPGTTGTTNPTGTTAGSPPPNPFLDPAMMQQLLALGGPGGPGGGGLGGGLGGMFGSPPTPADTRPPEERFQTQLEVSFSQESNHCVLIDVLDPFQQLNGMGFVNASQNIRALQATSGNVHAAIEYILNGGGL